MSRKVGRQEASRMMYLLGVMLFFATLPIALGIVRAISKRGVPLSCSVPIEWMEGLLGGLFGGIVVLGYLANDPVARLVAELVGGGVGLSWVGLNINLQRPKSEKSETESSLMGWEMSFGQIVWTTSHRSHAPSVFGWWRQSLGLVHFVSGLEVLHFRGDCDNGGKIEVKLVLVPASSNVAPAGFWEEVNRVRETDVGTAAIEIDAKNARSSFAIQLVFQKIGLICRKLKFHRDTEVFYTPPPGRCKPFSSVAPY